MQASLPVICGLSSPWWPLHPLRGSVFEAGTQKGRSHGPPQRNGSTFVGIRGAVGVPAERSLVPRRGWVRRTGGRWHRVYRGQQDSEPGERGVRRLTRVGLIGFNKQSAAKLLARWLVSEG